MDSKGLIAVLTNNDDDIYCFRKEPIEAFRRVGYDILISCPYGEKFELLSDIEYIYDNPTIDRRGTSIKHDFSLYRHYLKLFKTYKPDIVLTFTSKPNVFGGMAARRLKIPFISNVTGFGSVLNKSGFMKKFIMTLFKFVYKKAACVMVQNSANYEYLLREKMIKGDSVLIPGSGVALNRFPVQAYPDGGDGLTGDKIIFNYIGRVLHDKGIDDYIAAAEIIKGKYPNTEFNVIGFIEPTENHYEEEFEKLSQRGIVYYRGSQKDVKPWISRSHAIIHPSTYGEGMSNVLLENAASGRPIITTDNPGCYETVINGESGYIYKCGDVNELVEKVEIFLSLDNMKRTQMGLIGRKHVEENFSREIVIKAYLEKIEKYSNKAKN